MGLNPRPIIRSTLHKKRLREIFPSKRQRGHDTRMGKPSLFTLCLLGGVTLNHAKNQQAPWKLPPYSRNCSLGRNVLDECESIAAFLVTLRGGGDSYYGDYGRRKSSSGYAYAAESQDYYGHDDDSNDDDGDDEYSYYNQDRQPSRSQRSDYNQYEDMRRSSTAPATPDVSSIFNSLPSIVRNGDRRIGFALLGGGALVTMLGVSLFFNKALMRMGNLLFIAGVPMMLGPTRTMGYFLKPEKFRATACLAFGIFLVLVGSPVFGIALEIFGLLNLFGNMFPIVMALAKNMPFIGPMLSANKNVGNNNRYSSSRGRRGRDEYEDDPYYYDDRGYDDYYQQDDRRRDDDGYY
eukprot:scaffold425_cov175-Amphora_coffeaeformis.AAC.95